MEATPERKARKTYRTIEAIWDSCYPMEKPSAEEACKATKRLWRFALGDDCPYQIENTSGNRFTWVRDGVFYVNAEGGWERLIHDLSHYFHRTLYTRSRRIDGVLFDRKAAKPHSPQHARLERRLAIEAIKRGYTTGKLKLTEA